MTHQDQINEIHNSLINGQRRQAVEQIEEYGNYVFWADYKTYLENLYTEEKAILGYFSDMTISFFRIKANY